MQEAASDYRGADDPTEETESDTPRCAEFYASNYQGTRDFAEQLEKELRIARATIEQLKSERENWRMSSVNRGLAEQIRIAGDGLREISERVGQMGCVECATTYFECNITLRKLEAMRK